MNSKTVVESFVAEKNIALVGLSRKENQFSNSVYKELTNKGYTVLPINPQAEEIGGIRCYPDLASVKEKVGAALVMTPSAQVPSVLEEAAQAGIRKVWIQQGAESDEADAKAQELDLDVVSGECIMMFAAPVKSIHRFHRWIWKKIGRLPK